MTIIRSIPGFFVALATFCIFYSCAEEAPGPDPQIVFTHAEYPCYMGCYEYSVSIRDDGLVTFVGIFNVKVRDTVFHFISPAAVAALKEDFIEKNFISLKDRYVFGENCEHRGTDANGEFITFRLFEGTKSVVVNWNCDLTDSLSRRITYFGDAIDNVAGITQWLGEDR